MGNFENDTTITYNFEKRNFIWGPFNPVVKSMMVDSPGEYFREYKSLREFAKEEIYSNMLGTKDMHKFFKVPYAYIIYDKFLEEGFFKSEDSLITVKERIDGLLKTRENQGSLGGIIPDGFPNLKAYSLQANHRRLSCRDRAAYNRMQQLLDLIEGKRM